MCHLVLEPGNCATQISLQKWTCGKQNSEHRASSCSTLRVHSSIQFKVILSPWQFPGNFCLSPMMIPTTWPLLLKVNSSTGIIVPKLPVRLRLSPRCPIVWGFYSSTLFLLTLLPQVSDQYCGQMVFPAYSCLFSPNPFIFHK